MRVRSRLTRSYSRSGPTSRVLEKESRPRGRPIDQFRLVLRLPADVEEARALDLPVYLLTSELTTMLGCANVFPPLLLLGWSLDEATVAPWKRVLFLREESARRPRLEDLAAALLRFNPLIARALLVRNAERVDPHRLLRVVMTEGLEAAATLVRLQEFCPQIPTEGEALPLASLQKQDRNDLVEGLLA